MLPSYPILTNIGDDETAAPPEGILLWVGLSPLCVFITKSSIISIYHIYAISNAISGVYNHEAVPYELRGVKMFNSAFWVEADSHSSNEETAKYDEVRKEEEKEEGVSNEVKEEDGPPPLPTTCCMSGCANCVWLDYADAMVAHYSARGQGVALEDLLSTVRSNVEDPMVKTFIEMELKSKYKRMRH